MIKFFRPTFTKIALLVVISLLATLIGTNFLEYIDRLTETGPIPITFYVYFNSFFWFPFEALYKGSTAMVLYETENITLPFLGTIIYWYLLSCAIFFLTTNKCLKHGKNDTGGA